MPDHETGNAASTATELAALADTIERCRQRLASLASSRAMAVRNDNDPDAGDDMLSAIYEAERGLNNAHRLVMRAARFGR